MVLMNLAHQQMVVRKRNPSPEKEGPNSEEKRKERD